MAKDPYESNSFLWYVLQFVFWLYILGYTAHLVLIANVHVQHTYFKTQPYGTLFSERFVSVRWIFLMLSLARIFVPICSLSLILYRRLGGCSVFWFSFLLLFVILDVVVFTTYITAFLRCNGQAQAGNICNDLLWCCVPEVHANAANMCPNSVGCNPPVALEDLRANPDFLWLFWGTLGFVVADLLLVLIPLGMWIGRTQKMPKTVPKEIEKVPETFTKPQKLVHHLASESETRRPGQHFLVKRNVDSKLK